MYICVYIYIYIYICMCIYIYIFKGTAINTGEKGREDS